MPKNRENGFMDIPKDETEGPDFGIDYKKKPRTYLEARRIAKHFNIEVLPTGKESKTATRNVNVMQNSEDLRIGEWNFERGWGVNVRCGYKPLEYGGESLIIKLEYFDSLPEALDEQEKSFSEFPEK